MAKRSKPKTRNPIARDLRTSKYRPRVKPDRRIYSRKRKEGKD
jgi:hypothetical protein